MLSDIKTYHKDNGDPTASVTKQLDCLLQEGLSLGIIDDKLYSAARLLFDN